MSNDNPTKVEQDTKISCADDLIQIRINGDTELTEQELERVSGGRNTIRGEGKFEGSVCVCVYVYR